MFVLYLVRYSYLPPYIENETNFHPHDVYKSVNYVYNWLYPNIKKNLPTV